MKREHIIGVRVSETSSETRIVIDTVIPNSRNSRPDDPAHQEQRDEDGDERQADRHDRKADLARALDRRFHRAQPVLDMAMDVLEHDDRVVDDKTDRDRQRHQRQIVEAVAQHDT